ncbi:uncharacterized protein LOC111519279 [Drosophila willistoni]|uniref:uncharacterized protein LOC111519279 n=1 Tax=Drosophila willistoni TaxID=7260 RepID=UPI000C26CFFD|nr:uncharacterized protein LOC111519279 [Drosophila willistoni]
MPFLKFRNLIALTLCFALGQSNVRVGQPCPQYPNYPESTCMGMHYCKTLEEFYRKENRTIYDVISCGIDVYMELVCCPNGHNETATATTVSPTFSTSSLASLSVSEPQSTTPTPMQTPVRSYLDNFGHLASLKYYKDEHMDDKIYSCTALIIDDNFVLTTYACHTLYNQPPLSVRLGQQTNHQQISEIKQPLEVHEFDLVAVETFRKLNNTIAPDAKIAEICTQVDMTNYTKLFAVGFAQNQHENCDLFQQEMEMLSYGACVNVRNKEGFDVNVTNESHWCLKPINGRSKSNCIKCLRGSASVLHVERSDGGICVAGIATPTGDECSPLRSPLYYTSFLHQTNRNFLTEYAPRLGVIEKPLTAPSSTTPSPATILPPSDIPSPGSSPSTHSPPTTGLEQALSPIETFFTDSFSHIGTLYYKDEEKQEFIYSCTALIIDKNYVLATYACLKAAGHQPLRVRLGLQKNHQQSSEVLGDPQVYNKDLVILKMSDELNQTQAQNAKVAEICTQCDMTNYSKLFAVAFAQRNHANCGLFKQEMTMLSFGECRNLVKQSSINSKSHWCLKSEATRRNSSDCNNCLLSRASVLHIERKNGEMCVVGIATPISNDCLETGLGQKLYYTSLLEQSNREFFNNVIYGNENIH